MDAVSITLCYLVFAIVMFVWEKIPLSITAMLVSVGLVLSGVLSPKEAFAGFVDGNVLLFMAMFIVGAAFFETGVAQVVGSVVTKIASIEKMLIVAVMLITGLLSGFLSNTGTAAVLIPVAIGIAQKSGFNQSKFLIPLVLASAMGGNLSLIGAPGNMIAQAGLEKIGLAFGFFDYALIGGPILLVGIIYFLLCTILAMNFESHIGIKLYISAWIGALILVATNVVTETEAVKSIDMKTIFLFVGSLSIATALVKTGAGSVVANTIMGLLGSNPSPYIVMAVIFILSAVLTNFMSNTAATALLVPIGLQLAQSMGADPKAVLMATVIGASCAYATPIGMPANTMVYNIGGYSFMDYVKVGVPLIVIVTIVSLIILPIFFPFYP